MADQPQHSTTRPAESPWRLGTRPKVWAVPLAVVIVVTAVLASMYLSSTIHAQNNLHDFPVAIVNQDTGATLPDGTTQNVGKQITDGIKTNVDSDKFDLRRLSLGQAKAQLDNGDLYGVIVVPASFSKDLLDLAESATSSDIADPPQITVLTNPRTGTGTPTIVTAMATTALTSAQQSVGKEIVTSTDKMAASAGAAPLSGAAKSRLATPFDINVTAYHPLPDGTGNGLAAFYFALLLILAGFTGSMIVNTFVDSSLGFVPSEIGPRYRLEKHSGMSRVATLALKWLIMAAVAATVAAAYLGVSHAVGMPVDHPWMLFGYSAAMIWAVAVVAQAISAIFGGIGLLINLFVFVVFALPSAGGTLPPEATPPFFRFLGSFEPMHQIYLGARSVLYIDGTWDSGVGHAMIFGAASVVLGLSIGLLATRHYDRRGYVRTHRRHAAGASA